MTDIACRYIFIIKIPITLMHSNVMFSLSKKIPKLVKYVIKNHCYYFLHTMLNLLCVLLEQVIKAFKLIKSI